MSFVANLQRNPEAFLFIGGSRGGPDPPLPLYLNQTEDRRSQKIFWGLPPPPLPPAPPSYLKVWIQHSLLHSRY